MSAPEASRAEAVREAIAALRRCAAALPQPSAARPTTIANDATKTVAALQKTARLLCDAREPIAITLRHELRRETGLSLPMIEWGLLTSLSSLRHAPLAELAATRPPNAPPEVIGVVLAGNVFVAALRGLALPLLAGAHVIAKTATREGAYARAFQAALHQIDPALAARLAVVQFPREDEAATRALCTGVDALSVYGSDETVEQLRQIGASPPNAGSAAPIDAAADSGSAGMTTAGTQQAPGAPPNAGSAAPIDAAADSGSTGMSATGALQAAVASHQSLSAGTHMPPAEVSHNPGPRLIAHGHGLSAAYVAKSALQSSDQAARVAERVALDIAAYDQHGCLSPHFVLVEPGAPVTPQAFAQLLAAHALPALAQLLPPGEPTLHEQAASMQWQATAAVRGELYTHGVSFEPAPLRPSPGGRLISVYACSDLRDLLEPFAEHLKCVGVAADKAERAHITALLQSFCSAQLCRSGEMQTPAFDAWADGAPPLAGLVRA